MKKIKDNIPNFITTLNILCGCMSIISVFQYGLIEASCFIFIAAVFDFCDGLAARLLNASSLIGKELDSLADLISFGLAPGLIVYMLLNNVDYSDETILFMEYIPFLALIIPVFSAIRLAKFNICDDQSESFIGMPTPANAIFIASLPLAMINLQGKYPFFEIIANPIFLVVITFLVSFLLVSNLPMISLKFKNLKWQENQARFIFLLLSLVLLIIIPIAALPMIIILYILISIINSFV